MALEKLAVGSNRFGSMPKDSVREGKRVRRHKKVGIVNRKRVEVQAQVAEEQCENNLEVCTTTLYPLSKLGDCV